MFSMMSISPHPGQPTCPMSSPSNQKAGHIPCPRGIRRRASIRPYFHAPRPWVFKRAEVYAWLPNGSGRAPVTKKRPEGATTVPLAATNYGHRTSLLEKDKELIVEI